MESRFSDRREVALPGDGLASAAALADRVAALLREYRQDFAAQEEERRQREPLQVVKKPFQLLEVSYQMASHLVVAVLAPRVHPAVPTLTRALMCREYPQVLPFPCLTVLISGLHAKLALDLANFFSLPPFRWMEPRPHHSELLHPLGSRGLQFNVLGSVVGVGLGRVVVLLRQGLQHFWEGRFGRLSPCVRWVAGFALHVSMAMALAPAVASGLTHALLNSQLLRRPLLPTAVGSAFANIVDEVTPLFRSRESSARKRALCWEGAEDQRLPGDLLCPITSGMFVHPAVLHGMAFERSAAEQWVRATGRHPVLQNVWCHVEELRPAKDLEAMCHRLAAKRGWRLRSS